MSESEDLKFDLKSKAFKEFIGSKAFLVVDPNSSIRNAIRKMLSNLGAKPQNVEASDNMSDAASALELRRPHYLFVEYSLDRHCGLELLEALRKIYPSSLDTLFCLLSSTNSPAIASRAADDEVDVLVVKPFTTEQLQTEFLKALAPKLQPTDYLITLEKGKTLLREGQVEQALQMFEAAKRFDSSPATAIYYEGHCQRLVKNPSVALECFHAGLELDPNHYKCLQGIYELHNENKEYEKAYEAARKLYKNFPVNPKKIPDLIRLSLANKKFEDIEDFYQLFASLEQKDEAIGNYVAVGLAMCGKHFIASGAKAKGLEIFKKALMISGNRSSIFKEMIRSMTAAGMIREAEALMSKAPADVRNTPESKFLHLEYTNLTGSQSDVIRLCTDLIQQGLGEPRVHEIIIKRSIELGRRESIVDTLLADATRAHPDKAEHFKEIVKSTPRPAVQEPEEADESDDEDDDDEDGQA